jgi:predicted NBD/HSP70 family sugar kinase
MMSDRARERLVRYPNSAVLGRTGGHPERINSELLFEAAAAGDPLADEVVDEACEALAIGIGALVNLLNPEVIVITGSGPSNPVETSRRVGAGSPCARRDQGVRGARRQACYRPRRGGSGPLEMAGATGHLKRAHDGVHRPDARIFTG